MKRRQGLIFGLGAAAAVTGLLWRQQHESATAAAEVAPSRPESSAPQAASATRAPAAAGASDAGAELWTLRLETPEGSTLALADFRGQPLLLNFWATWCPPCVKELPLLDRFAREQAGRGWRVLGLAIDRREPVREFLQRVPVGFPTALAGIAGTEWMRRLGNNAGALPFSVAFGRDGQVARQKLGEVTEADLAAWVRELS